MATNTNPTKVIIPCRISFANIWQPKAVNGGDEKYSVSCVIPKSDKGGSVAPATPSNGSGEYAVRYWATYIDGKKVREVDQLNFICYVNGTDYLADVRKALGM